MVDRTSSGTAPWTIVESNDKLFARIKVLRTICERLEKELKVDPMKEARVLMPRAAKAEALKEARTEGPPSAEHAQDAKAQKAKTLRVEKEKEAKDLKAAKAGEKARPAV